LGLFQESLAAQGHSRIEPIFQGARKKYKENITCQAYNYSHYFFFISHPKEQVNYKLEGLFSVRFIKSSNLAMLNLLFKDAEVLIFQTLICLQDSQYIRDL
jgi:hypothetical protein